MAIIAININKVVPFSLLSDSGDNKTVFNLGVIDSLTRSYIDDQHLELRKKDNGDPKLEDIAIHDKYVQFVRFGLRGWENFKDAEGKDVPFETVEVVIPRLGKKTVVSEDCLKKLELMNIVELGIQILNINHVKAEDQKNL